MEAPPSVTQARCGDCGGEMEQLQKALGNGEKDRLARRLECQECNATPSIMVTRDGIKHGDSVDYSEASWNQTDEEKDGDEDSGDE